MTSFNIVEYIEQNPLANLSNTYQSKLINKIKERFTDEDQHIFVASFYTFLKYDKNKDFVIDLDNIWQWFGFNQKEAAKRVLDKNFIIDRDYVIFAPPIGGMKKGRGGHNKETILMTIKTFKKFCLKADTKKADQIHEYYINLEEILQEVINEESNELKLQLENQTSKMQFEKELLREKTILEQFPHNSQCVYYGIIDNKGPNNETLIKFGNSNFLYERVEQHKKTYTNFRLVNAFKVDNKLQVENAIKQHSLLSSLRVSIKLNSVNYTELLNTNDLSFDKLDKLIKEIIVSIEYNPDNYRKLLTEHQALKKKYKVLENKLKSVDKQTNVICYDDTQLKMENLLLIEENQKLKIENIKFIKKYKLDKNIHTDGVNIPHPTENIITINDNVYNNVTNSMKKIFKSADGFYYIDGIKFNKCFGSREDVWNGTSYKTSGGLKKNDLLINKLGCIISKKKFILEKQYNRLHDVNMRKKANARDNQDNK
jgi:hypothetical protein